MTSTTTSSLSPFATGRRRTGGLIAVVVIALLLVGWWATQPAAFPASGDTLTYTPPDPVDERRIHVDTGISPDRTVHVIAITPVYERAPDDIDERVSFHRCPTAVVGVVGPDLATYCPSPQDVEGDGLGPDDQVVLGLTVDAEPIHIDGFVVTYRSGLRVGRQHTGAAIEYTPAE